MTALNRIVLVRHGETVGQSSIRYYGATDVALSDRGREQVREAALALPGDAFDLVLTSPLSRAWESARMLAPNGSVRILDEFREIDFGRWEGLTADEIRARDPIRYQDWQQGRPGFEYPDGERRADFQARVDLAVDAMVAGGLRSILVVVHKGVIRAIVRKVVGEELAEGLPELGGSVQLTRDVSGRWFVGRHGNPALP
ncbi:MAG: histidine phosphatase family protein [Myxococcota bacterium]